MPSSYYFWKWADNDLPGKPPEVWAALLRGEMHPALKWFDARPLLNALEDAAAEARAVGEEWEWEVHPPASPEKARFVFVTCPPVYASEARARRFLDRFAPLDVSGCDDDGGKLIPGLDPKLNYFLTGQVRPCDYACDITADELPFFLRRIRPDRRDPWGDLVNRRGLVTALAEGRRFRVQWTEWPEGKPRSQFILWHARDPKRLAALAGMDNTRKLPRDKDPAFLTYADTLRIFKSFLRCAPRPPQYCWRKSRKSILPF